MKQNRGIYILIVLVLLVISVFYFRNENTEWKTNNEYQTQKTGLDRSIDELVISKHAKCRMECRDVTKEEIKAVLKKGTINYSKTDLNDKRGPSYAVEGYGDDRQYLRIVFAPKNNKLVVVTCIDLDKEWQCDCN